MVYLIHNPVGGERDATRRLGSNSHLVLSDVESLADSLSGEVLGPTLSCEGAGLDVPRCSLPDGATLLWRVEISEHSNVRLSTEELVFERSESQIIVLVVEVITFGTIKSPPI